MKDVLVCGAGGGMGSAAVSLLAKNGYRVFALDLNEISPSENVVPIKVDVTSEEGVRSAYDAVREYTDTLYGVIHFAGIYMLDSLVEMKPSDFKRIFDVNLYGVYLINRVFMPLLKKGSRMLITTSELAVLDPLPFTGIYAVSKAALDKYAYSLRMELQLLGVSVSVLRAGAVNTGMLGVSTAALDRFCDKTELYACNSRRFKDIVDRVEARCVSTERLAKKAMKIIGKKKPSFAYSINRNPLLRLLNFLPKRLQLWIIKKILA